MPLTGSQIGRIQDAIFNALDRNDLRRVLRVCMDERLEAITSDKVSYKTQVFELVEWADRNGRILDLLQCAHQDVPGNVVLSTTYVEAQIWAASAELRVLIARVHNTNLPISDRLEAGLRATDLGNVPPGPAIARTREGDRILLIKFRRTPRLERDMYRLRELYDCVHDPQGRHHFEIWIMNREHIAMITFADERCTITNALMDELEKHFQVEVSQMLDAG